MFDFEKACNKNLRGEVSVIMANPSQIKTMCAEEDPSLTDMLRYVKSLTPETLKQCKEKNCQLYSFSAQAGDVIYTPAGFLTALTVNNRQHVFGMRQSVLPTLSIEESAQQIATMSAMEKCIKADRSGANKDQKDMGEDGTVLRTVMEFLTLEAAKLELATDQRKKNMREAPGIQPDGDVPAAKVAKTS